jgi:hypothetical protein
MATPAAPLPGETPEQRRARLSAAYAVQARIDAQRQAELEAQEEARRKEMQARIDNMLRSAYVLPPLPQLPVPMPVPMPVMREPMPPSPVKTTRPDPNVIQSTIVTADGRVPNPAYTADVAMQQYRAALLNDNYHSPQERQQIMSSIESAYAQPGATGQQLKDAYQNASAAATRARHREQEARNAAYYAQQPPAPLSNLPPDVVAKPIDPYLRELITPVPSPPPIPTYYDPVPPVVQPTLPPVDIVENIRLPTPPTMMEPPMPTPAPMVIEPPVRVVQPKTTSYVPGYSPQPPAKPGELGYLQPMLAPPELRQPTPTPIETLNSALQNVPAFFAPGNTDYGQPAQPSAGMGLSRLAPPEPYTPPVFEPYTPPMAEPYTPPSMQFSVDMPRMDYARDLYGVIPDNVSMLKRGGLAVKPKKGKC